MSLQVVLGFDVSASMQTADEPGVTRIGKAKELARYVIIEACKIDPNGPDALTFGQRVTDLGSVSVEQATDILGSVVANEYATNFGAFLAEAFIKAKEYIGQGDEALILAFTDGAASDRERVEREIIDAANGIEQDSHLALEIVYFGDEAKGYLADLDDSLQDKGAKFDIVDATPIDEAIALDVEALLNKAFND